MIISHKYKFLFIGLPFSASSAISKELHLEYDGEPYLRKHSLYHEFKNVATKLELKYFVFAVLRNPMEIAVTVYEKMRANAKGNFTNPELFSENGGHITKQHRERFNYIKDNNSSFQQYFKKFHQKPYDNLSSLTIDNCDFVIRYETFSEDYLLALKKAGISNPKPLPVVNKTVGKNKEILAYYTDDIKDRAISIFGPFLEKYDYSFPEEWGGVNISLLSIFKFKVLGVLRRVNERFIKKHSKRKSISGTIYGDMQRDVD